jgi:hypothetical protein
MCIIDRANINTREGTVLLSCGVRNWCFTSGDKKLWVVFLAGTQPHCGYLV